MNHLAIDDLVNGLLARWCESAAEWEPPGQTNPHVCQTCSHSTLAELMDVASWPHDLMHQLAFWLDDTSAQIVDALDFPPQVDRLQFVRDYVIEAVRGRVDDLIDVLVQCVEPRLEAYAESEVARALSAVDLH